MTKQEELAKAIRIVSTEFESKVDKGGRPYILHCLTVMNSVKELGYEAMTIAVLHDLLEDCPDWTTARLHEEGFSYPVVNGVSVLTKQKEETYQNYIIRIGGFSLLKQIKIADLKHNMDVTRLGHFISVDIDRLKKYIKAYRYLTIGEL